MTLSRKHYVAIAEILNQAEVTHALCRDFAEYFAKDNPRFDEARFLNASYYRMD